MNFLKFSAFLLLISLGVSSQICAQDSEEKSTTRFDLNFNSAFNSYYYQDALSATIQSLITNPVTEIDKNDYILGPSDLITVSIEGPQNIILRALLINAQGDVVLPMLGSLNIANQTISEAEETINEAAGNIFKSPQSRITLERPRPLNVQVTGAIEYPGKQQIPAFSRIDEAVYMAMVSQTVPSNEDGETTRTSTSLQSKTSDLLNYGNLSLRNIKITHLDGSTTTADLISYFRAGTLSDNPIVKSGDVINVDRKTDRSLRISISGAVERAQELEYSPNDTPILLLKIAGGFTQDADTSYLNIVREEKNRVNKIVIERDEWNSFKLQPNDRIIVPPANDLNNNASAWVYGEVDLPGNFPIQNGETTALQLLDLAGNFTNKALPSAGYLIRAGSIENEIPNKFNTQLMKRTSDQLSQGFEYLDLETRLSQNKVFVDLTDNSQLSKVNVYDGDRLYVPRDEETLFVFGQVNNPGYYPYTNSNQTVSDYVSRAGGFALSADRERVFVIKAGSGTWYAPHETELESGDRIFVDRVPYDELNAKRNYEIQKEQLKNNRIQLILTAVSTITGIITTYVAIQNIRN